MLNVVSEMIETKGSLNGRVDHVELLRRLTIPADAGESLVANMGIYRLDSMEREVVVRMMLGEGTKEICYHQGISRDRYYGLLEKIGRKLNGGVGSSYGDRTVIVLALIGIGPRQ
jgi:DNA-binding CsgD family transcriptional regulator